MRILIFALILVVSVLAVAGALRHESAVRAEPAGFHLPLMPANHPGDIGTMKAVPTETDGLPPEYVGTGTTGTLPRYGASVTKR